MKQQSHNMKITVKGCVDRTETLPKELLDKPEFKKAIEKAGKIEKELESLKKVPEIIEPIKKPYKKQDND